MSIAEIIPDYSEVAPSRNFVESALADTALATTSGDGLYRPDFMRDELAESVVDELRRRGVGAQVIEVCSKGIRSERGSSFAIKVFSYDETVRPFSHTKAAS